MVAYFAAGPIKKEIRHLLWITLYQILFMEKAAYHVVGEAVGYAKARNGQKTANFVNAILRKITSGSAPVPLPSDPLSRLSVEHSFPHWLIRRWRDRFGDDALKKLLFTLNEPPEFTLRIDLNKTTMEAVENEFARLGIVSRRGTHLETALTVRRLTPVLESELFTSRLIHVQDETSQVAATALAMAAPHRILDACAGQGTKTDHIRQLLADAEIVAMDLDKKRLRHVRSADLVVRGNAVESPFKKETHDSILLDAPCSSLGIVRKHPEIRWRRNEKDVLRFADVQTRMIRALSGTLKKGGSLIYSVCSFEPEETSEVVERAKQTGLFTGPALIPGLFESPQFLSLPHVTNMDGFFVARLVKQ
jgi:16S rRNA (cytosine967-C5)-methyltransferase